jgi:hypothetical protein
VDAEKCRHRSEWHLYVTEEFNCLYLESSLDMESEETLSAKSATTQRGRTPFAGDVYAEAVLVTVSKLRRECLSYEAIRVNSL